VSQDFAELSYHEKGLPYSKKPTSGGEKHPKQKISTDPMQLYGERFVGSSRENMREKQERKGERKCTGPCQGNGVSGPSMKKKRKWGGKKSVTRANQTGPNEQENQKKRGQTRSRKGRPEALPRQRKPGNDEAVDSQHKSQGEVFCNRTVPQWQVREKKSKVKRSR